MKLINNLFFVILLSITSSAIGSSCVDTDGDGIGTNENGMCVVNPAVRACVDIDGDGFGWNGSAACEMPVATA